MTILLSQTRAFFDQRERVQFGIDSTVNSENFLRLLTTRDRDCLTWLAHYLLSINHKEKALVPYWLARNARTDWNDSLIGLLAFPHRPNCFPWTATVLLRLEWTLTALLALESLKAAWLHTHTDWTSTVLLGLKAFPLPSGVLRLSLS